MCHSEFDYIQYPGMGPSHIQCSTFTSLASTLALKLFRGEPAISGFDWNFTPSHSSSANVSTGVGSVLHRVLPPTSTWPWLDHPVSGLRHATFALLRLAFASAPHILLNLAPYRNSPVHSTKGTLSPL